jgi:hypothetical protein
MPDGRIGRFEVPEGTTPEQAHVLITESLGQQEAPQEKPQEKPSIGMAAVTGVNTLVPSMLGLPVDTVTNIANLGIAGYGVAKHALTGSTDLPEPLPPQIGGSESIARGINTVLGEDVFSNPRPDSKAAEMLHTGAAVTSGALVSPASSMRQAAVNAARMLPSGAGAAVAQQVAPDNPLAPVVGALAVPGAMAAGSAIKGKAAPRNVVQSETLAKAQKEGLVVPPAEVDPSMTNTALESISGKAATAQSASLRNQRILNKLAAEELSDSASKLGISFPRGKPITEEALSDLRMEAGKAYRDVKAQTKPITIASGPKDYLQEVKALAGDYQQAAKEFPDIINNKEITTLIDNLSVNEMSPRAAVELSRNLRYKASKNLKSFDNPERAELGMAQRKAANLVEELVQSNLEASGKGDLSQRWKDARSLIAKTHDVESALNNSNGNIDARVFAKLQDKNRPLTGKLELMADFATAFPRAVQDPTKFGSPGVSKLQAATAGILSAGGGFATGGPGAIAGAIPIVAPAAARGAILSRQYQRRLLKESPTYEAPTGLAPATLTEQYQQRANELKQRMAKIKADREISNRQRREQLNTVKSDMNDLFKDAGQHLERTDFRELRSYVNGS